MNKTAVIYDVARAVGLPFSRTERIVNSFLEVVSRGLANGERVTITGFGTFEVRKRKARLGRIPRTGQRVSIPEHLTPAFIAGVGLKKQVEGK
uniref:HU family DNA-binding protein n=1 Tax=candidate division WWE3 bacterium TaxID=2053526 RepID=A0A832E1Y8_UNCKA